MATGGQKEMGCNLVSVGTLTLAADLGPTGIVVSGDMLMVTDFKACKVQVYRRHDGKLLSTTDQLESCPLGICFINDREICVALDNGTIEIMKVEDTGMITRGKKLHLNTAFNGCHGVVRFMDKVVVCGVKQDAIFWCIASLIDGGVDTVHKICKGNLSHLTTKDNIIYISCFGGPYSPVTGVYGYNILNPRQQRFIYKHKELYSPRGITVDKNGFLFVCNWSSIIPCIHHLTEKCEPVTIYWEGIPRAPYDIFWDHEILYVTSKWSNVITRYIQQYSHQQGDHKASKVSNGRNPVIEEASIQIEQGIIDKWQPSTEAETPPSVQVPKDFEDDKQDPLIPVEILHMDDKSLQLYKKALQDGKEKVYNIRVMVVGQYGVGKTTLTKRLLGQQVDISKRESTEGIDVYKHCCKISLDTGEWIEQHEDSDQMSRLQRLRKLLSGPDQRPDVSQEHKHHFEVIYQRETTSEVDNTDNNDTATSSGSDQDIQLTSSEPAQLSINKVVERPDVEHAYQKSRNVAVPVTDAKTSDSEKKKDAVIEILRLINENADKLEKDIVKYAALSMWDFAGQYAFYTTHQTFLTSHAIYLLVIDLHQQVTDLIKDDKCFLDTEGIQLCKVHDLIEIWLNSIHSCSPSPETSIPNVILVGTHVDKLSEESRKEVIDEYFKELRYMLREKPTIHHLMDDIAIDNTQHDPMLEELKRRIFELSSQQPHWGEEKPARWLPLEQAIMTLKASGVKVVTLSLIEEINMSGSVRIEDRDELELFLRFHHEMGTILYFSAEGLREKIVLDPQWMIDALKSLITAETFIKKNPAITSKLYEFIKTGKLTHEVIDTIWTKENKPELHDNKEHILLLMEQLNIIARPRLYIEEGEEPKEENYFLAPCMLQQKTPEEVICPKPTDQLESSSVLCYVFIGKFLPSPIFHRLLAACIAQWPIVTMKKGKTQENLIFCGCCVFQVDIFHRLTIHFREYVIFLRVTRMGIKDKTPSSKQCIKVREFITTMLHKIIGYLGQSLKFEHFIQCPEYNGVSIDSLIPVSLLKENAEVPCDIHDNITESCKLLKYWFEDQEQSGDSDATSAGPMSTPPTGDTDRFMRITYLLVDVGSQVMRQLLSHHTVTSTSTLDQYLALAKTRSTINSLLKKKVLNQSQMDIMFPPNGGSTNLDDYDITLLSALFNNIVPSLSQQETNMIKSLREDRNKLYGHAKSCQINASDFQTYWNDISSTLITLSRQCGDSAFEVKILQEIQRTQISAIPAGSYLDILKTWFGKIETVEGVLQNVTSRLQALESKEKSSESKS